MQVQIACVTAGHVLWRVDPDLLSATDWDAILVGLQELGCWECRQDAKRQKTEAR